MGVSHPSIIFYYLGKDRGIAAFLSLGERLVLKLSLVPGYSFPVPPWVRISGGTSMATSFLLQSSYVTLIGLTLKIPYAFVKKSHLSYGEPIRETEVGLIASFSFY